MASGSAGHWVQSVCGFRWCSTGVPGSVSSICCCVCLIPSCVRPPLFFCFVCMIVFLCVSVCEKVVFAVLCVISLTLDPARFWPTCVYSPPLPLVGAHFTRHQHSHATSCRHFHLGAPQAPISAEFPLGHASQPPQTGLATHLPPAHHPPLTALPAPPQFQDVPGPPFLPQALHQQYLIQQQLLEAQHRRILPHSRYNLPVPKSHTWVIVKIFTFKILKYYFGRGEIHSIHSVIWIVKLVLYSHVCIYYVQWFSVLQCTFEVLVLDYSHFR